MAECRAASRPSEGMPPPVLNLFASSDPFQQLAEVGLGFKRADPGIAKPLSASWRRVGTLSVVPSDIPGGPGGPEVVSGSPMSDSQPASRVSSRVASARNVLCPRAEDSEHSRSAGGGDLDDDNR